MFKSYCTRPLLCNVQSIAGNFRELMPSDMQNTPCVFLNFIITENVKENKRKYDQNNVKRKYDQK